MATGTLSKNRTTPGVYITEIPAFGNSVVGVPTAIPVFVGYTEFAVNPDTQKPAFMTAVALTSMMEYTASFGGDFRAKYAVAAQVAGATDAPPIDFMASATSKSSGKEEMQAFSLQTPAGVGFHLYAAMRLFFANGGSNCYVVSVKDYWGKQGTGPQAGDSAPASPTREDLLKGLEIAADTRGPTMVIVPSACDLDGKTETGDTAPAGYADVVQAMLMQAGKLQDRVAIIDLPCALDPSGWGSNAVFSTQVDQMASAVSPSQAYASYGAAYGPALQSTIYGLHDVDYLAVSATQDSVDLMNDILTTQAKALYAGDANQSKLNNVIAYIQQAFPSSPAEAAASAAAVKTLSSNLLNALPVYGQIMTAVLQHVNAVPPSGAMAGIWAANDTNRGVWNAPANMGVALASQPKVLITDAQQGAYNVPLNGYSVSILRAMPSRGVVVWGARTLDGNSNDFRYVQVRRTLIYLEQSIKAAIQPFVFAANDAATWISVTSMISNFLTNLWQAGGLMGSKPSEAFSVNCGLGSTMSAQDVLNGYMIVAVSVSLIRPAEFIELTFTQTMQGS